MEKLLDLLLTRKRPADPELWHEWNVGIRPVTTVDGGRTLGRVERRYRDGSWQYRAFGETAEQFDDRQW